MRVPEPEQQEPAVAVEDEIGAEKETVAVQYQ